MESIFEPLQSLLTAQDKLALRQCSRACRDVVTHEGHFGTLHVRNPSNWIPVGPSVHTLCLYTWNVQYRTLLAACPNLKVLHVLCDYLDFTGCTMPEELHIYFPCTIPDTTPIKKLYWASIYENSIRSVRAPTRFPNLTHLRYATHYPPPFPYTDKNGFPLYQLYRTHHPFYDITFW